MSRIITNSITMDNNLVDGYKYLDPDLDMILDTLLSPNRPAVMYTRAKNWSEAVFNSTAKNELFPNDTAHPVSYGFYLSLSHASYISKVDSNIQLIIGSTTISSLNYNSKSAGGVDEEKHSQTGSFLSSVTKSTKIYYQMNTSTNLCASLSGSTEPYDKALVFELSFNEYDTKAYGMTGVSVDISQDVAYDGDNVTWAATPSKYYDFVGWYSDSTYTNLVSTNPEYTTSVYSDVSLYALCTRRPTHPIKIYYGQAIKYSDETLSTLASVYYNGTLIGNVDRNSTLRLNSKNKIMLSDVIVDTNKILPCKGKYSTEDIVIKIE